VIESERFVVVPASGRSGRSRRRESGSGIWIFDGSGTRRRTFWSGLCIPFLFVGC